MKKNIKDLSGGKRTASLASAAVLEALGEATTKKSINKDKTAKSFKEDVASETEAAVATSVQKSVKKDFKALGGNNDFAPAAKRDFKSQADTPVFKNQAFDTKKSLPNRDWGSDSENEDRAPEVENCTKIEGKHNSDNMKKYIKNQKTIDALNKKGITYLFPIQEHCFQAIQAGKDLIGKDRTGSGKTLGFALPLLEKFREAGNKQIPPPPRSMTNLLPP